VDLLRLHSSALQVALQILKSDHFHSAEGLRAICVSRERGLLRFLVKELRIEAKRGKASSRVDFSIPIVLNLNT